MGQPTRFLFVLVLALSARTSFGAICDAAHPCDPPPSYYDAATGTGATLKSQLNTIIKTGYTALSYDSARTNLQVTDADPNNPGHMLSVYDRASIDVAAINPGRSHSRLGRWHYLESRAHLAAKPWHREYELAGRKRFVRATSSLVLAK